MRPAWVMMLLCGMALIAAGAGCGQIQMRPLIDVSPPRDATPPDDPNIIGVRKYLSQEPWLSFNPSGIRDAEGFKATVYLESGTTGRGAFGDGVLRITMYSIERTDGLTERLKREYQWNLSPSDTLPWRAVKPTRLGWGYGLRLSWEGADVNGKEIQLVFQFVRNDGRVVSAEPVRLRVPARQVRVVERDDTTGRTVPASEYSP